MMAFIQNLAACGFVAAVCIIGAYCVAFAAKSVACALSDAWDSHLLQFLLKEWKLLALCIFLLFLLAALSGCVKKIGGRLLSAGTEVCNTHTGTRGWLLEDVGDTSGFPYLVRLPSGSSTHWYASEVGLCSR